MILTEMWLGLRLNHVLELETKNPNHPAMSTHDSARLPSYATLSHEDALHFAAVTLAGTYDLALVEKDWSSRQPYLENNGYMLRTRYRPRWSPSWLGTNRDPTFCEDSIMLEVRIH